MREPERYIDILPERHLISAIARIRCAAESKLEIVKGRELKIDRQIETV